MYAQSVHELLVRHGLYGQGQERERERKCMREREREIPMVVCMCRENTSYWFTMVCTDKDKRLHSSAKLHFTTGKNEVVSARPEFITYKRY